MHYKSLNEVREHASTRLEISSPLYYMRTYVHFRDLYAHIIDCAHTNNLANYLTNRYNTKPTVNTELLITPNMNTHLL